jgi:hypothetical protein
MDRMVRAVNVKLASQVGQNTGPEEQLKSGRRVLPERVPGFKSGPFRVVAPG